PKAYHQLKELYPAFGHKLDIIWKDLGPRFSSFWTSIDIVHFLKVGEGKVISPIILWISVAPGTLLGEDAHTSVNSCLDLLKVFGSDDVEVKFWESIYT
ncbi:hypothetical protein BYT27DRAFT_7108338, partial [Phlegmacium glaucopus]